MTAEIQSRFEDAARYEEMMSKVFPGYAQIPLVILSLLRPRLGPSAKLLDAGCGTGASLATFAASQPQWSYYGVDPAEPMLEVARARIRAIGKENKVTFFHGTVDTLPDQPEFDAATCILVEHLLPDDGSKLHLLEGIKRRIVPGGWFVLFGLHGNLSSPKAQDSLEAWLEFVTLQGLPQSARDNVRQRATIEDALVPEKRILELLIEAGFVNIERFYQLHLLGGWLAQTA
jgi:tRNA (cmo5U34)-methyltransferase